MSNGLTVRVSAEDFKEKDQQEQMGLIYSCLLDLQKKTHVKWKHVLGVGAAAGFAGGLLREKALPLLTKLF